MQQPLDLFIGEYLAMWHEPDANRRRVIVERLWAPEAENITRTFTARGLEEIVARVDTAHAEWVHKRGFIFRPRGNADSHNHLIKSHCSKDPCKAYTPPARTAAWQTRA
jgi:hypothetical protein